MIIKSKSSESIIKQSFFFIRTDKKDLIYTSLSTGNGVSSNDISGPSSSLPKYCTSVVIGNIS